MSAPGVAWFLLSSFRLHVSSYARVIQPEISFNFSHQLSLPFTYFRQPIMTRYIQLLYFWNLPPNTLP